MGKSDDEMAFILINFIILSKIIVITITTFSHQFSSYIGVEMR